MSLPKTPLPSIINLPAPPGFEEGISIYQFAPAPPGFEEGMFAPAPPEKLNSAGNIRLKPQRKKRNQKAFPGFPNLSGLPPAPQEFPAPVAVIQLGEEAAGLPEDQEFINFCKMLGLSGRVREGLGFMHELKINPNDVNLRERVSKWANCSHVESSKWEKTINKAEMLILLEPDPERRKLYRENFYLFTINSNRIFKCSTYEEASARMEECKIKESIKNKKYNAKKKSAATAQPGM